jgi:hypothetical protein
MTGSQTLLELLKELRNSEELIAALRLLKNEITGHDRKKEKYVEKGVLDRLVRLLHTSRSAHDSGKGRRDSLSYPRNLSDHEELRLQILQILAVIANGMITAWSTRDADSS